MPSTDPFVLLGLTCPDGGKFYICQGATSQFLGCCTEDPCFDRTGYCPQDALRHSSFNKDNYRMVPPQSCVEPYDNNTWYTCQNAVPPFIGCCASNPCNDGCGDADLLAARLSDDSTDAAVFITTTASATASATSTSSPAPTWTSTPSSPSTISTGGIIGVSIGGTIAVITFVVIFFFLCRRRAKRKRDLLRASNQSGLYTGSGVDGLPSPYQDSLGSPGFHHPPQYAGSQYGGSQHGGTNTVSMLTADRANLHNHRDSSQTLATSWVSGHSPHGFESSYNTILAHQKQVQQQHLNPVSEIDGIEMGLPLSELPVPDKPRNKNGADGSSHGSYARDWVPL